MPCFYCGKRVSLVRQMNDADFCSDEHRKRYHSLTNQALNRLVDYGRQHATPPLRPEAAVVPEVPTAQPPAQPVHAAHPTHPSPQRGHKPQRRDTRPEVQVQQDPVQHEVVEQESLREVIPNPILDEQPPEPQLIAVFEQRAEESIPEAHFASYEPDVVEPGEAEPHVVEHVAGRPQGRGKQRPRTEIPLHSKIEPSLPPQAVEPEYPEAPLFRAEPMPLGIDSAFRICESAEGRSTPRPALCRLPEGCFAAGSMGRPDVIKGKFDPADLNAAPRPSSSTFLGITVEARTKLQTDARKSSMPSGNNLITMRRPEPQELRPMAFVFSPPPFESQTTLAKSAFKVTGPIEETATIPPPTERTYIQPPQPSTRPCTQQAAAAPEIAALAPTIPALGAAHTSVPGLPSGTLRSSGFPQAIKPASGNPLPGSAYPMNIEASETEPALPKIGGAMRVQHPVPGMQAMRKPQQPPVCVPSSSPMGAGAEPFTVPALLPETAMPTGMRGLHLAEHMELRRSRSAWSAISRTGAYARSGKVTVMPLAGTSRTGLEAAQGDFSVQSCSWQPASVPGPSFEATMTPPGAGNTATGSTVRNSFGFSQAGFEPLVAGHPMTVHSEPLSPSVQKFSAVEAKQPTSCTLSAGRGLPQAGMAPIASGVVIGKREPAEAEAVALSTAAIELPASAGFDASQLIPGGDYRKLAGDAFDREAAEHTIGWQSITIESRGAGCLESGMRTASWTAETAGFETAHEFKPFERSAERAGSLPAPAFAQPEMRLPALAETRLGLGDADTAKLQEPSIADDAKTTNRKGRTAAAFRLSSRPSRLPVLRATVEKAHMPYGVFCLPEMEDHDDDDTVILLPGFEEPLRDIGYPEADFELHCYGGLGEADEMPVDAGPYAGDRLLEPGYGEQPYESELFFVATGISLLGMDFEAIADAYEPRWRSALKTASGLFRGMLMFIPCILVMSSMLTSCSASGSTGSVKSTIQSRAAMQLEHDFSQGLEGWYGGRDWSKNWVREAGSGYVKAGELALYRPSQTYVDYRLEFLGQIDKASIGWVYRATDLQNYYVTKLVVTKPGPLPQMAVVRYAVINGKEGPHSQVPVQLVMHNGHPYRIQQDVSGSDFTTSIEGQVVDFWSDDRQRTGGVGFLADKGDAPHLYWMKVSYHDDFLGKLCATIAPTN